MYQALGTTSSITNGTSAELRTLPASYPGEQIRLSLARKENLAGVLGLRRKINVAQYIFFGKGPLAPAIGKFKV